MGQPYRLKRRGPAGWRALGLTMCSARSAALVDEVVTDLLAELAVLAVHDQPAAVEALVGVERPEAHVVHAVRERLAALPLAAPGERPLAVPEADDALRLREHRPAARRLEDVDGDVVPGHAREREPQALAPALGVDALEPGRKRARAHRARLRRRRVLTARERKVQHLAALHRHVAGLEHVARAVLARESPEPGLVGEVARLARWVHVPREGAVGL